MFHKITVKMYFIAQIRLKGRGNSSKVQGGLSSAKYLLSKFSLEVLICKVRVDLDILKILYKQLIV